MTQQQEILENIRGNGKWENDMVKECLIMMTEATLMGSGTAIIG